MPHFIIDCSENILQEITVKALLDEVYRTAESSGLFAKDDIKVRLNSSADFRNGAGKTTFLHIFGHIMEGRTDDQKARLSKSIVSRINELLPNLSVLSMNISEFQLATYCNKAMLDPKNTQKDRHFSNR